MDSALRQSVIALLLAAVAGCGQMGPLYLPDEAPAAEELAPAAEDSPPSAEDAEPAHEEPAPVTEDPAPAADATRPDDEKG